MAEVTREVVRDRRGGSGVVAWLALLLAIAALLIAWMAYNRSGGDLEDRVQQQVNRALDNVSEEAEDIQSDGQNEVPGATDNETTQTDTTQNR
jgi:hypothetical protein